MKHYFFSNLSCVLMIVVVMSGSVALLNSSAQAADARAAENAILLKQELTAEKILMHLPLLVTCMRERQADVSGMYPPLPKELDISIDTSTITNIAVTELMAIAVRDMPDNERREQALSTLNPLLLDAISGKVLGIPPDQTLDILFLSEFYRDNGGWLPIVRKDSQQTRFIVDILADVLLFEDANMSKFACGLLWSGAHFLEEQRDYICEVLDAFDDSLRMKDYFERPFTTLASHMSPEEYNEIQKMPMKALALVLVEKPWNTIVKSTLEKRLKDGDPESDATRVMLLSKQNWQPKSHHLWAVPPAVAEEVATPEQQRTRNVILNQLEAEVDTSADGERFSWATGILSWLARPPKDMNIYSQSVQYRPYGSDSIISILNKILYKAENGSAGTVLDILDNMMKLDESIREFVCANIRDYADRLASNNAEWKTESWFVSRTEPPQESGEQSDARPYYRAISIIQQYERQPRNS